MVKLKVMIAMELEGVTDVQPADDDFQHYFTVICTSCREEHPKIVSFNAKDEVEISGSRGTAHFVWRCSNCKKEHSASIIPPSSETKSLSPLAYPQPTPTRDAPFSPFIAIDCRGLEFTKYHFRGKWTCVGEESGTKFEFDLDEEEDRWDDYDEKAEAPVAVSEFQAKVVRY